MDEKARARKWIDTNWDPSLTLAEWMDRLVDSGWAAPSLPPNCYGLGIDREAASRAAPEFWASGCPGPPLGLGRLAVAALLSHGSDEQAREYVRSYLTGEMLWCQLYSEPGAGSDLASVQTRAQPDIGGWRVNGQKVWTTGGAGADLGMLLARTDVDAPKHRGISWFVLDMQQPGVEVRPLRQMTGESHFSEVFLTDAWVPAKNLVGRINEGWAVALATQTAGRAHVGGANSGFRCPAPAGRRAAPLRALNVGDYVAKFERGEFAGEELGADTRPEGTQVDFDMLLQAAARERHRTTDPIVRQELAKLYILRRLRELTRQRAAAPRPTPGPEGSIDKLSVSRIVRHTRNTASIVLGVDATLATRASSLDAAIENQILASPAASLYGGTDEIQRNVLAERVLRLPK